MATNYAQAVRAGALAASRIQRKLCIREHIEAAGGAVNVFSGDCAEFCALA